MTCGVKTDTRNFNLSPQGDGNHHTICFALTKCGISTYPRKGTETVMDDFATGYLDFNLSPQGDGNIGMTA